MKMKLPINLFKGAVIGASMIIPGVSGGTTAIILGIYDRLISSVSSFFKSPKMNFVFLASVCAGGALGALFFSKLVLFLLGIAEIPMMFLFIGAVLGSLPLLCRQAGLKHFTAGCIGFPLTGIAFVALMSMLPENLFVVDIHSPAAFALIFAAGMLISLALILPGISTSYMLLILGIYQPTLTAIEELNLAFIFCLGSGIFAGVIFCTKALESALNRFPQAMYLIIIGFVIASLKDVFPGLPSRTDLSLTAAALFIGCAAVYFITRREKE